MLNNTGGNIIGGLDGIFDPGQVAVSIVAGGSTAIISGFGETIGEIDRTSPQADSVVGADGRVVKWYTNDRRGIVYLDLLPTAPSNAFLTGLAQSDETNGGVIFAINIKDLLGHDLVTAPECSIKKRPKTIYKKGIEMRRWEIEAYNLDMKILGQGTLS